MNLLQALVERLWVRKHPHEEDELPRRPAVDQARERIDAVDERLSVLDIDLSLIHDDQRRRRRQR